MPPVLDFLSPQSARHSFSSGPSSNPVGNIHTESVPLGAQKVGGGAILFLATTGFTHSTWITFQSVNF
jgi:hypothetical protein